VAEDLPQAAPESDELEWGGESGSEGMDYLEVPE
jgi:hypothetical protein